MTKQQINEKKLFQIFKQKDGLELYQAVKDFVLEEKQEAILYGLQSRYNFATTMMNIWNNAGWDDGEDHSRKLDIIRTESNIVGEMMDEIEGN